MGLGVDEEQRGNPIFRDPFGLVAALLAPLTWGLTGVFVRLLDDLSAPVIVVLRLLIGFAAFTPWLARRRSSLAAALRSPFTLTMGAYYVLATEAFVRAPVADVTLVIGTAPVVALGLERWRGRRAGVRQWVGAMVALVGLVLFLWPGAASRVSGSAGYLLAFGAACVSAVYAVGLRARSERAIPVDPIVLTAGACLLGAVMGVGLMLLEPSPLPVAISLGQLGFLAPLGLVCTATPTLAYGIASTRLPAVVTTSLGMLTPVFAALFAGAVLGEWPVPAALPGAAVLLVGLALVLGSR